MHGVPDERRRPQRGEELRELAARVGARLLVAVPEAIRASGLRGTFYCLVLGHGEAQFALTLLLGRESDRRAILVSRGAEAKSYLYTPADPALELADPVGARDRALLDEGIARQNAWELGRRTLRQAARELSALDWSGVIDVTDDFVVLALDYEADELVESLAECAPPERLALLRARGLV